MQPAGGSHFTPMGVDPYQNQNQNQMVVEEASPISSRPPAAGNLDEFMPPPGTSDMDSLAAAAAAGEDTDRGGFGGSSGGGGNRWPRQETLALLRIRSEMDAVFRDATVKGPLWEDVSRKLAELGYKRSAKKCKEKFENVDKYYKRTKEGRAGRQDGKTYKFFSELEALHNTSATLQIMPPPAMAGVTTTNFPPGMGFSSPTPISSIRPHQPSTSILPGPQSHAFPASVAPPFSASPIGFDFSSNSSSSSHETEDDEDVEGSDPEGQPSNLGRSSRKRKRGDGSSRGRMMVFFEGLMKQVMQKQEAMQQRFLEAIEKREHDRLIGEEAWRRQEMARLAQEHEIMARERAVSASRDASIMAFLQKITGQTIQLPSVMAAATATATFISITPTTPAAAIPQPIHMPVPSQQPISSYHPPQQKSQQPSTDCPLQVHPVNVEAGSGHHQSPVVSRDIVLAAVPEQQVRPQDAGGGSGEPPSSRWPKAEVLALIKLRSGLESRYQEVGPKGPLWEEISAGMHRMGYRRNPKRCKEKWENINKYFKKVKESNKKRPEDAKTCPYFHELDALYRKKFSGGSSSVSVGVNIEGASTGQQKPIDAADTSQQESQPTSQTFESETKGGNSEQAAENMDAAKKPEDTVKDQSQGRNEGRRQLILDQHLTSFAEHEHNDGWHGAEEEEDDVMDEEDYDDEDEEEEELEEDERKVAYKIDQLQTARDQSKRQQQNAAAAAAAAGAPKAKANGGGSGAATATASFMAMVQ